MDKINLDKKNTDKVNTDKVNTDKSNFAFGRTNYILLAISVAIVIIGFVLMSGPGTTEEAFNPDIFGVRRTKVAPVVCLVGFLMMIYAVIHKPTDKK